MTAWHAGRTFYACICGARDESPVSTMPVPAAALDCWLCGAAGAMRQWVPPGIRRAECTA